MAKEKILVVDDEHDIVELINYNLLKENYLTDCVFSGEEALALIDSSAPDLVLLDLMLPGIDGLDVCRALKSNFRTKHIPVIMLTARSEDADVVTGLEIGADDYIVKPFSPRVLLARIRNVLRRNSPAEQPQDIPEEIKIHGIIINPVLHQVKVDSAIVELTATEFAILKYISARPGWVFSRDQIINAVKGEDYPVTDRSVDVQIVSLRKKLGSNGKLIETIRGIGYRMKEENA